MFSITDDAIWLALSFWTSSLLSFSVAFKALSFVLSLPYSSNIFKVSEVLITHLPSKYFATAFLTASLPSPLIDSIFDISYGNTSASACPVMTKAICSVFALPLSSTYLNDFLATYLRLAMVPIRNIFCFMIVIAFLTSSTWFALRPSIAENSVDAP